MHFDVISYTSDMKPMGVNSIATAATQAKNIKARAEEAVTKFWPDAAYYVIQVAFFYDDVAAALNRKNGTGDRARELLGYLPELSGVFKVPKDEKTPA